MKSGVRALGVAESYGPDADVSTLAGCVVRADRVVDGVAFGRCTVGGFDVTTAIIDIYDRLDREDIRYLLIAGVALSWYNIIDLDAVAAAVERPVIAVSFESSPGLDTAIQDAFEDPSGRLDRYDALPEREPVTVNDETIYLRAVECSAETAEEVVASFTPAGGRPEPLRVARFAARAADDYRRTAE